MGVRDPVICHNCQKHRVLRCNRPDLKTRKVAIDTSGAELDKRKLDLQEAKKRIDKMVDDLNLILRDSACNCSVSDAELEDVPDYQFRELSTPLDLSDFD